MYFLSKQNIFMANCTEFLMTIELISDGPEVAAVVYLQSLQRQEHEVYLKSGMIKIIFTIVT
jgi:hypothetical protein